jgi:hypothetical protein
MDIAIPSDSNAIQRKTEKKLYIYSKYRNSPNLEYEMLRHTSNHWDQ